MPVVNHRANRVAAAALPHQARQMRVRCAFST
jgi:hypothetical protein